MPENSWPENDSYNVPDSLHDLLMEVSELSDSEVVPLYPSGEHRRRKAALVLALIWSSTLALHVYVGGFWLILGLTMVMGVHSLRLLIARPPKLPASLSWQHPDPDVPRVSLLVAAKNEAAVIGALVKALCELDYPRDRYELWLIDDNSSDQTPTILDDLAKQYSQLRVLHRTAKDQGGKSGALNQVLPLTQGDIIGVFDADAQVPPDLLRRVVPFFSEAQLGAVQVRKAITNYRTNFWTQGQATEMALDTFFQQQRIAIGGIGELRGNGQFVRRQALEACGGWNEATITDDLDLTLRLHLNQWDIDFLPLPPVQEEGVTYFSALWHQRNRWAEGGYQRYLDYWPLMARNRLGPQKTFDLVMFWITQYGLPTAAVPDLLLALVRQQVPLLAPVTSLTLALSFLGMLAGLNRIRRSQKLPFRPLSLVIQALQGTVYMMHWFLVVASMTTRVAIRPKRLKWVKTMHQGEQDAQWLAE
ncbi:glycosyltransferase [Synechococcales cyanobacterium C]|uniref:Beta-monoglucosyldiacylglycerol synthase n=1 Tax=Petrachloros mirabilis ULC683 TaxID=2781853 RepID=A0A8K1ZYQ3_9CYAN|nr:glycosyltransferase family 2 protein [Petrachloros mirabilis]NCJ06112.1 glycosyltransferase [Petrachloros mirabilis ULC683]